MSALLIDFVHVNDALAATSSKLRKQAILAEYLRKLDEPDLRLAVRFAAGRAFSATDERVLNVGGRATSDVILSIVPMDPHAFHDLVVRSGEIGEALAQIWPASELPCDLTLREVAESFDRLAATGVAQSKRIELANLLTRSRHPREATYLAKIIFGDLRTGVQEGVLQAAVAEAFGKTLAQITRCQLLVGDLDEVAVLAKNDALDAARFRLFHPLQFMLATAQLTGEEAAQTLAGRVFRVEDKLDGIRAQVHKSAGRVAIYTRTMDRADDAFPEVVQAAQQWPGEFLLDGEIVPWKDGTVLPFAHLQRRLGRKAVSSRMRQSYPVAFIAFDLLYADGQLLIDCPLSERRSRLEALVASHAQSATPLVTLPYVEVTDAGQISAAFDAARARRNEGIVLKDPSSCYAPGRRGQNWLKLKGHLPTFDCVVTAAEYGNGKRRASLSDYTFAVWSKPPDQPGSELLNVGKAYSGVTDAEIAQLTEIFLGLSRGQYGRVHAVEPKIVLEIACDQIQKSARHASGYALRFPRIKTIRWDKRPQDADTLDRVIDVYESQANFGKSQPVESAPEPTLFDGL